ncbi:MAG: IS5 family transposase [Proteobacteria bacterium]|nr:IS5 family transposase [Pseudomonadota bacterium]
MTDKFTSKGFADYFIEQRGYTNSFLEKIDMLINWKNIESLLNKKYKKVASADGRPAYPALPMFKLLLLQRWNGLSDPQAEVAIKDRISFILFTGFSISSPMPDYSTICRFRNNLLELNLYEKLMEEINSQIEFKGLMVKKGAIVDATIVESSRRPRKVTELMPEDRMEEKSEMPASVVTYSDDPDANWIKKGKRAYYGYKGHISVDAKEGFILGGHVTPASTADTKELERVINESHFPEGSPVFADKGYASAGNRNILADKKLIDGIMHKAARNKPLTPAQRIINRLISSVRYKVEQSIGTLKRGYQFFRMRYKGLKKGNMEFLLNAMAFNLKKAAAMIE